MYGKSALTGEVIPREEFWNEPMHALFFKWDVAMWLQDSEWGHLRRRYNERGGREVSLVSEPLQKLYCIIEGGYDG